MCSPRGSVQEATQVNYTEADTQPRADQGGLSKTDWSVLQAISIRKF